MWAPKPKAVTAEVHPRGLEVDGGQFDFFPVFEMTLHFQCVAISE